jgi:hypothetical protein
VGKSDAQHTPNVDESRMREQGWKGQDTGRLSGNHTANTPDKDERRRG